VAVLVDEKLSEFIQPYIDDVEMKQPRVLALLPQEMSRATAERALGQSIAAFEVVSAPFGPRKLARAIEACEKTAAQLPQRMRWKEKLPKDASRAHEHDGQKAIEEGDTLLQEQGIVVKPPDSSKEPALQEQSKNSIFESAVESSYLNGTTPFPTETIKEKTSARRLRLLLVDDNDINLRLLESYVRKKYPSCPYDCAINGQMALDAVESNEDGYTMILMDLSMPIMDGLEATRRIRQHEQGERQDRQDEQFAPALIVALTGLANERDQQDAYNSGCDMFMTKPVKLKEVGKLLDQFLEEQKRQQQNGEN